MNRIIDLSIEKKVEPEKEDELMTFIDWLYMIGFSVFLTVIFLCGLCGGRFW